MSDAELERINAIIEESNIIERILKDIDRRDYGMTHGEEIEIRKHLGYLKCELEIYYT